MQIHGLVIAFSVALVIAFSMRVLPACATSTISAGPANPIEGNSETKHWFFFTIARGEEQTDAIALENTGDTNQTILLYPADTTPSTDGGFALKQRVEEMTEVGAWVTIDESQVTLAPGEQREVDFTLNIPRDVEAGEYAGAIMVEPIGSGSVQEIESTGIHFNVRYGTRIYATVADAPITSRWLFWVVVIGIILIIIVVLHKIPRRKRQR